MYVTECTCVGESVVSFSSADVQNVLVAFKNVISIIITTNPFRNHKPGCDRFFFEKHFSV